MAGGNPVPEQRMAENEVPDGRVDLGPVTPMTTPPAPEAGGSDAATPPLEAIGLPTVGLGPGTASQIPGGGVGNSDGFPGMKGREIRGSAPPARPRPGARR